jgi:hypothetical protein
VSEPVRETISTRNEKTTVFSRATPETTIGEAPSTNNEKMAVFSRATIRSRPVAGGKKSCSRCDDAHLPGSAYCRKHKNEQQRDWQHRRAAEFKAFKLMQRKQEIEL